MGFIYRDIKPENILLDSEGHLKITDFGLSKAVGNQATDQTNTLCGTPQYLAPEVILKKGYNKMVDWWGLGILIYEMAVGVPPFNHRSNMITMNDIVHEEFIAKDWLSKPLQNLLYNLLDKDPNTRLGSPQSGGTDAIKSHPFFDGIDWTRVLQKGYPAPIKPKVKSRGDTKHISKLFLK
jgi:serine/threonine protein kinase